MSASLFRSTSIGICSLAASLALAAQAGATDNNPVANDSDAPLLPVVTVTAEKQPTDIQTLPLSVTAVTGSTIQEADIQLVKQASVYAPNVFMNEFSVIKLSNPYFRGIGASPQNPGVTTFIDGVPQLNANSSNIQFLDIDQIEFVRGPQSALYGRNTAGGLIGVASTRPSLSAWTGSLQTDFGSYDLADVRFTLSGPIVQNQSAFSFAGGFLSRDGYTKNSFTGNNLDFKDEGFGKFQLELESTPNFEARLIFSYEHDADGDYALGDLNEIRQTPFTVSHDFVGYTRRDLAAPTLLLNYYTDAIEVSSITGGVWWKTTDSTDLDYTALPLGTRWDQEEEYQFTQELRFASLKDAPLELSDNLILGWQSGVFVFNQNYDQNAHNDLLPDLTGYPFTVVEQTNSKLTDWGTGLYGQGMLTAWKQLDFVAGLRYDYENKGADLLSYTVPGLPPVTPPHLTSDFSSVSPQFSLAWHVTPNQMLYGSVTRGFKAGGFNAEAPANSQSYGPETSWNYEIGAKSEWLGGKLRANAALFYIAWDDLQLNVPLAGAPGTYFIANAGSANSKGAELEFDYRPFKGLDLFNNFGYTDAQFDSGTQWEGINVGGNQVPYAPEFTENIGTEFSWELKGGYTPYIRAEDTIYGNFKYDASNVASQGAYNIADFRVGVRTRLWFAEVWIDNAFGTNYVPLAFQYPGLAPSGYVGEAGAPMTVGCRLGVHF